MRIILATNWWSLVIRGVLAILLGVITFAWPGITLTALVFLFGAYALLDGTVSLIGAVRAARAHERWGALLIEGFAGIAAAMVTVVWPPITGLALVYIIGAWAVVTGIFEMVAAARLRKYISGEWLLALSGLASLVFGILIMIAPLAGALVIALWVGAYALVFGALLVGLGFRLRAWAKEVSAGGSVSMPLHDWGVRS
jgi:uncharacterized membrane protein HdeD (DUF308 family)